MCPHAQAPYPLRYLIAEPRNPRPFSKVRYLVFKGLVFALLEVFWARALPLKFPITIGVFAHKIFGPVQSIGPKKPKKKKKCSKPPIVMGNFNGNALAQKIAKKGKNWTLKHYFLAVMPGNIFGGKGQACLSLDVQGLGDALALQEWCQLIHKHWTCSPVPL